MSKILETKILPQLNGILDKRTHASILFHGCPNNLEELYNIAAYYSFHGLQKITLQNLENFANSVHDKTHPDLHIISDEKFGITISRIHEYKKYFTTTPHQFCRVFIFDKIEYLEDTAIASLLKTLEEPAPKSLFFLLSRNKNLVMDTIRSRSIEIRYNPFDNIQDNSKDNHRSKNYIEKNLLNSPEVTNFYTSLFESIEKDISLGIELITKKIVTIDKICNIIVYKLSYNYEVYIPTTIIRQIYNIPKTSTELNIQPTHALLTIFSILQNSLFLYEKF